MDDWRDVRAAPLACDLLKHAVERALPLPDVIRTEWDSVILSWTDKVCVRAYYARRPFLEMYVLLVRQGQWWDTAHRTTAHEAVAALQFYLKLELG